MRGGRVLDATGERAADVRIVDGRIAEVGPALSAGAGATVLDAEGAIVTPGLVDLQVHFREPGREDAEDVESGARAAALGGCTAVVCMPNTDPPLDDAAVVEAVLERGRRAACDVRVAGCITKGREGIELAPLGELYDAGVRIFTDDGDCVADAQVMRHAFEYASALAGAVIAQHAEDPALVRGGHMHEGAWSARLGIPGRPAEAESSIVARDLALARMTGGRYHVLHLSTAQSAHLVRAAKAEGVRVTAECTPQHLVLTDERCAGFDPVFKMNPPLREQADVDALRAALARRDDRRDRDGPRTARAARRKTSRSRTPRPACSASRPRSPSCTRRSWRPACSRSPRRSPRSRGSRRASPASTPTGTEVRSRPGRPRTSACSTRTRPGWSTRRGSRAGR